MSTNILFVFEGEKTEDKIVKSLENRFLNGNMIGNTIIKCVFGAEIYQLYRKIQADPDLDIFNLIKDRNAATRKLLENFKRDDFAEIYLFFDYDGHASLAASEDAFGNTVKSGDEKLSDMLALFDNETDNGKLYISYPMVEALRHIIDFDTFFELTVKCKGRNCLNLDSCPDKVQCLEEPHYKNKVSIEGIPQLLDVTSYTSKIWKQLIKIHLFKMNYIVNNTYSFPNNIESQYSIFQNQLEKYISQSCPQVSVLCSFPVFVHDYFGNEKTKELILID